MGRQKIEMKKTEKKSSLKVTFSKRRAGLFKKAGELCVLCGAEVIVIVFFPGLRAFVFDHPFIDTVIERFLEREKDSHEAEVLHEHVHKQYLEALGRLEVKKKHGEAATRGGRRSRWVWWDAVIESMGLNELEQFGGSLEELMKKGLVRLEEMTMMMIMMEGGPSSTTMVEYGSSPSSEYSSTGVPHGHDLAAYGVPQGFEFGFSFNEPRSFLTY